MRTTRGVLFVLAGSICWGFSATCIQLLVRDWSIPVTWVTSLRLPIAGFAFLLVAFIVKRKQIPRLIKDPKNLATVLAFGIVGIAGTQLAYFYCTLYTNAGTSTTLERLALLIVLGWTCIRTRRFPFPREIVGILLAFVGVFLIATQGNVGTIVLPLAGLLWGLGDAVGTACYMVMPTKPLQTYHPLVVTGVAMSFAGIVALVLLQPWNIPVETTPGVWWIMFLLISLGTIVAYACFLQGIKDCGAMLASMLSCAVPVSALIISALWLKTPISLWDIAGCALILGMVLIVTKSTNTD